MEQDVIFEELREDLTRYIPMLVNATEAIMEQDVSNYPIFVAHKHQVELGIPLLDSRESKTNWSLNASTLEEFVAKNIVAMDKVENFKQIYKNPKEFVCVFILDLDQSRFVFHPVSTKHSKTNY